MTTTDERNWAGNLVYRAERLAAPKTQEELSAVLAEARRASVIGTRHCFNDIADTTGTLISLAEMPREIDVVGDAVRVSAGTRYGDIAPQLQRAGRALGNLASLPHISVAGAVATGTHGSGDRIANLSAAVRAMTLVTADGDVRELRRGDDDFPGAVVHLGALGVVTHLELDTEPDYEVAQRVFDAPRWADVLARFDEVTALGDSVSIFTAFESTDVARQLWVKRRVPHGEIDTALIERIGARPADGPRHPIPGVFPDACSEQNDVPGPWFERLPHFRLAFTPSVGEELQSEYLLPRERAAEAIDALQTLSSSIAPLLHVCEIRTMKADDLWLSPAHGRDSVGIHFTWHRDEPAVRELLPRIEAIVAPLGARPHWGKIFTMPGDEVRSRYDRWEDFRELQQRLDPRGIFRNAYLERVGL
ncbi:D-arabinono-1,4-lactone oxidase [Microbacterium amylolyticum]|uniref:Xylitol oxidase n=1 Tax=Microbacterium amylolyticum TaxID=936337 RepID=A0ABS4ZFS7_9MICO|nr:D-arabinono-1,4-lactone oxidase [Microbacterium amylolyticum]MBP2435888.1 xylitol oxidase [Microbacterium amylolyticum]